MKSAYKLIAGSVIWVSLLVFNPSEAQQTPAVSKKVTDQWMSHQMNQPPPAPSKKYRMSQELVNEIKELYLEAEKQFGNKPAK